MAGKFACKKFGRSGKYHTGDISTLTKNMHNCVWYVLRMVYRTWGACGSQKAGEMIFLRNTRVDFAVTMNFSLAVDCLPLLNSVQSAKKILYLSVLMTILKFMLHAYMPASNSSQGQIFALFGPCYWIQLWEVVKGRICLPLHFEDSWGASYIENSYLSHWYLTTLIGILLH